jgi:pyridoxine 4-dehydrogenase
MLQQTELAGSFTLPGTTVSVNRTGYGAMQLAGRDGNKLVWGPPRNVDEAIAVLQEAVASGVNHIDTADFYGPHVTNQIIRKALPSYPGDLVMVTKVGARRGEDGSWIPAFSREELTVQVHAISATWESMCWMWSTCAACSAFMNQPRGRWRLL